MSAEMVPGWVPDDMFRRAERDAKDYSAFPGHRPPSVSFPVEGLLDEEFCRKRADELRELEVDDYIAAAIMPAEDPARRSARSVVDQLKGRVIREVADGPFYGAEISLDFARRHPARRISGPGQDFQQRRMGTATPSAGGRDGSGTSPICPYRLSLL